MRTISWLADELFASQEALCSMEYFKQGNNALKDPTAYLWKIAAEYGSNRFLRNVGTSTKLHGITSL